MTFLWLDGVLVIALAGAMYAALQARTRLPKGTQELNDKIFDLERRIQELLNRPEKWEYRIERFDVLWYPIVTISPSAREILSATPGVPHCGKCVLPLSMAGKDWTCRQCGEKRPESLADVAVMDSIMKLALQYFQERHPDYRLILKK